MASIFQFIVSGLWFWIAMGAIVSLIVWVPVILSPRKRARFTDDALREGLKTKHPDKIDDAIYRIVANRVGVIIIVFVAWPAFLYLMIFRPRGSDRNGR